MAESGLYGVGTICTTMRKTVQLERMLYGSAKGRMVIVGCRTIVRKENCDQMVLRGIH